MVPGEEGNHRAVGLKYLPGRSRFLWGFLRDGIWKEKEMEQRWDFHLDIPDSLGTDSNGATSCVCA